MKNTLRFVLLTMLLATMDAVGSPPQDEEAANADCSFSNPNLSGLCKTTVPVPRHSTPQLACEDVLLCLKSSACADSQKYCYNPGVQKDWKLEGATASTPPVNCAFSNPSYSGWCRVTVQRSKGSTPQQVCEAVLRCMNGNPCEGNYTYCTAAGNPRGWRLEEVTPSAATR